MCPRLEEEQKKKKSYPKIVKREEKTMEEVEKSSRFFGRSRDPDLIVLLPRSMPLSVQTGFRVDIPGNVLLLVWSSDLLGKR